MGGIGGSGLRTYRVQYDGPGLELGVTFGVNLFAFEDIRVTEIEFHRVTSVRNVQFTTFSNDVLIVLLEDFKTEVDALEESDFREIRRFSGGMAGMAGGFGMFNWEVFRDKISYDLGVLIDLLTDDPTPNMFEVFRKIVETNRVLQRVLERTMTSGAHMFPHPVARQCNDIVELLRRRLPRSGAMAL